MDARLPSLDVIADEVRRELDAAYRHFDGLDSKAGVVLGFSAAVTALTPAGLEIMAIIGRVIGVLAAVASLVAFFPREFPVTDLRTLRDNYLRSQHRFTQLHLLDTHIEMSSRARKVLTSKARRLKVAMVLLLASIALVGGSILIER